jgi:hypothetical protein
MHVIDRLFGSGTPIAPPPPDQLMPSTVGSSRNT